MLARPLAGLCVATALVAPSAHAGLFDDDEARRAILDIRQRIEQGSERQRAGQAELTEQITQLKRSLLELNNQLEQMRGDNAKLRGQNEELARAVSDMQRKQKDLQSGVEDRMRKFEPQNGQRDRDRATRFQHHVDITVVRIVVVVDVAAKTQVAEEELVDGAQFLQRHCVGRNAPLQPCQQLVYLTQDLLHIEFRVFVLGDADGRFEQGELGVAVHQRLEVFKRCRD